MIELARSVRTTVNHYFINHILLREFYLYYILCTLYNIKYMGTYMYLYDDILVFVFFITRFNIRSEQSHASDNCTNVINTFISSKYSLALKEG